MSKPDLSAWMKNEREAFISAHPTSKAYAHKAKASFRHGVAFHWMSDWASPFPLTISHAKDATVWDCDGIAYDDFCLGDTPSMYGHARDELSAALSVQMTKGFGAMLPNDHTVRVGEALKARFGFEFWQIATTASDANRNVLRWARSVTGRSKILVFNGCYHGQLDEGLVACEAGHTVAKAGLIGQGPDPRLLSVAIEFNDARALEAALSSGEFAAVLFEPVMTNCGMIAPKAGFLELLLRLCRDSGTLSIADETHTLSSSHHGYCREHGLKPDMVVIGKAIGGGIPTAVFGFDAALNSRMDEAQSQAGEGSSGMGTTLSANSLALCAIATMLDEIITEQAHARMNEGALRLKLGLEAAISRHGAHACVVRVGARVELIFAASAPSCGGQMKKILSETHEISTLYHLYLLNRGIMIAPFHTMMLISPVTHDSQIERLIDATDRFFALLKNNS